MGIFFSRVRRHRESAIHTDSRVYSIGLSFIFDPQLALHYDIPTYSLKNSDTTDRYGQIITVGGVGIVGSDFSQ